MVNTILTVILLMIIHRPDLVQRLKNSSKWIFVYGRRKTGKTFIVETSLDYDEYFFVNRNRTVLDKNRSSTVSYETFGELLRRLLEDGKTVVVDEFHRLGDDFLDLVQSAPREGKLILITSTLFLAREMLGNSSPILGLFNEVRVGIISLGDALKELQKTGITGKNLLEMAIIAREPLAIDYVEGTDARAVMRRVVLGSMLTVPALIGEIFSEEERTVTNTYSGILSAVATGNVSSGKIANFLYSRRLIKKDDPSIIQALLGNLVSIGLLKRIRVYNRNKFAYKFASPLVRVFYYGQEKYGISERDVSAREIDEIIDVVMPRIVEDSVREYISDRLGLIETIIEDSDYDVDGYLLRFQKPMVALEVKWKNHIERINEIESKLLKIDAQEHILVVPSKKGLEPQRIRIMDVHDLIDL